MDAPLDASELLCRIGDELETRSADVEALGELLPLLPALEAPLQRRAQSIDLLAQELGELAALLRALAGELPSAQVPDRLVGAVRLSALAARLRARQAAPLDPAGEFDLF